MWLYGHFGSKPWVIGEVLDSYGISYSSVEIDEMTEAGTYIFSYWNEKWWKYGLHTVAIRYDGNEHMAYNYHHVYREIDISKHSKGFICCYYLG